MFDSSELDITSGPTEIRDRIEEGWKLFGHIDVVLNNAGMSAMKSAEEAEYAVPIRHLLGCQMLTSSLKGGIHR